MSTTRSYYEDNPFSLTTYFNSASYEWPIGPVTEAQAKDDDDYAYEGAYGYPKPEYIDNEGNVGEIITNWTKRSPLLLGLIH